MVTTAAEIVPEVVDIKWTINSKKYAYPEMTIEELVDKVAASYTSTSSIEKTRAIVAAYGLAHPQVIAELELIAKGNLMTKLLTTTWKPGDPVSTYFKSTFQFLYPAVSEMLLVCFGAASIASTSVEVAFSLSNNQVHKIIHQERTQIKCNGQ